MKNLRQLKEKLLTGKINISIKKSEAKLIDYLRQYFITFITVGVIKYIILDDEIFNKLNK